MNYYTFVKLMKATFKGIVINPVIGKYRPTFYIPSIKTIVAYERDGNYIEYTPQQILEMKYEVFNLTIDPIENQHLYERIIPREWINFITIKKDKEVFAIQDIMCSVEGNVISYEGTLRLRERNRKDSEYDLENINKLKKYRGYKNGISKDN